ncbi:MAG: YHS domain-containing protein [Methanobacteriota archaeon]|nr:MAG: YHS domain-containing protein [Euryarchaeota archaeon]
MAKKKIIYGVCGSPILKKKPDEADYKGHKLYFCTKICYERFKADPEGFLKSSHVKLKIE